jgi:hypothetical protein
MLTATKEVTGKTMVMCGKFTEAQTCISEHYAQKVKM